MKIGVVDYLNAYPLWAALENDKRVTLVRGVPSFLANELFAGCLEAALISSVEYLRHREDFAYHPGLCIAAHSEVLSIRLFTQKAAGDFVTQLKSIRRIYTDVASRSSVAQLQIILRELRSEAELEEITAVGEKLARLEADEALLTIGDTALKHLALPSYDLQKEYFNLFQRGFVYALWAYRKDAAAKLEPILSQAFADYKRDQSHYLQAAARFGFSAEFTQRYLTQIIQHELTEPRRLDLAFFAKALNV